MSAPPPPDEFGTAATPEGVAMADQDAGARPPLVAGERPETIDYDEDDSVIAARIRVVLAPVRAKIEPLRLKIGAAINKTGLPEKIKPALDRITAIKSGIGNRLHTVLDAIGQKIKPVWEKTGLHRLPWAWILFIIPAAIIAVTALFCSTGVFLLMMTDTPKEIPVVTQTQDVVITERTSTDDLAAGMTYTPPTHQTQGGDQETTIPDEPPAPTLPHPTSAGVTENPDAKVGMIPVQTALIEQTEQGYLPHIGRDGSKPWQVYRRPAPAIVDGPKIALIMTELGLSENRTNDAIRKMPGAVTLAFLPYVQNVQKMIDTSRDLGHEVLLNVPMEPLGYPRDDPGPHILREQNPEDKDAPGNIVNLYQSLGAANAYVGIISFMGSALAANEEAMSPIMKELARRGLVLVDNGSSARSVIDELAPQFNLPTTRVDRTIDIIPQHQAIDDQLAALEKLAHRNGSAVGIFSPLPISLERLALWIPQLASRGITLVPVSALLRNGPKS